MLIDYENQFTADGGQPIVGSALTTKYIDLKAADDIAVGEPVYLMARITETFNAPCTDIDIALQSDDETTFAGAATVLTANKTVANNQLDAGKLYCIGAVPVGTQKRYLSGYITCNGGNPTTGKIELWLVKGTQVKPYNEAITI